MHLLEGTCVSVAFARRSTETTRAFSRAAGNGWGAILATVDKTAVFPASEGPTSRTTDPRVEDLRRAKNTTTIGIEKYDSNKLLVLYEITDLQRAGPRGRQTR